MAAAVVIGAFMKEVPLRKVHFVGEESARPAAGEVPEPGPGPSTAGAAPAFGPSIAGAANGSARMRAAARLSPRSPLRERWASPWSPSLCYGAAVHELHDRPALRPVRHRIAPARLALLLLFAGLSMAGVACGGGEDSLVLGATTSVQDTGLLDELIARFETE